MTGSQDSDERPDTFGSDGLPHAAGEREAAAAAQLAEETELGPRHIYGWGGLAISLVAGGWSLFQLSLFLPWMATLNSDYIRSIHLSFAMALVFLSFPAFKKLRTRGPLGFLSAVRHLPWVDVALALVAALTVGYYALDYVGIGMRQGDFLLRDIAIGVLLIVLLLEAARRSMGPALPCVAAVFIAYAFLGPHMPGLLAARGVSLDRLVGQLTLSTEGIYGIPLRVSASTVFLFVLLGAMLEHSGGGHYFVQLAFSLLGRFKGGPAKAAVLASGMTGLVSGSSIANTVTTGTFTIPLMKRCGYPAEKAAAVEVAASTNGQLMPPIMGAAAFIIAEYCRMPYLEVVRAAFIPAIISYLALIYITHLEASKLGLRGLPKAELPRFLTVFLGGIHFLVPLAILIVMLLRGWSAQMAAVNAIAALAALVVARSVIQSRRAGRRLADGLRAGMGILWKSMVAGGRGMMAVGVACATAGIIVGVVNLGLGHNITEIVASLSGGNIFLILALTAFVSLVLGMGLPTTATYIVMASLTAGVIVQLAGDSGFVVPLIAAHLFCFYFGILADDTPPVGLAAYAASAIARSNPIKTGIQGFVYDLRTAVLPFMFVFNTDFLLIGIRQWWHVAIIFAAGTMAMLAFAALTQNYFAVRNRVHESALLVVAFALLARPQILHDLLGRPSLLGLPLENRFLWYAAGAALFGAIYLLQRLRARARSGQPQPLT